MKIAIAGYGVEGRANYDYWSRQPDAELTIVDEQTYDPSALPEGVPVIFGEGAFSQLQDFDLVIRTAGLAPHKIHTDGKIWSATNEFFANCPAPIIGVTGSKGKGTTVSLIAAILEAAGKKVWVVGNIGTASLEVLDRIGADDIVVYELSSFQLWDIHASPRVAVVLFIEPEHLDVHTSMEDYVSAKARIAAFQSEHDIVIYNTQNQYAAAIAAHSLAHKVGFPDSQAAHISDGAFWYGEQKLCSVDTLKLQGSHNYDNTLAAISAAWEYTHDPAAFAEAIGSYTGLPHRLAYVATVHGVDYYDDSIATTPTSAVAAMRAFDGRPQVLILGGSFKGSDFSSLADEVVARTPRVLLIGDEADRIAQALTAKGYQDFEILDDQSMPHVVQRAAELASEGGVVLLSPAAASFGLFKNYSDRGDQFIAAVRALGE